MPNGEGTPDPRYSYAKTWGALLLGLLSGALMKGYENKGVEIIEVSTEELYIIIRTEEGNFKVALDVTF